MMTVGWWHKDELSRLHEPLGDTYSLVGSLIRHRSKSEDSFEISIATFASLMMLYTSKEGLENVGVVLVLVEREWPQICQGLNFETTCAMMWKRAWTTEITINDPREQSVALARDTYQVWAHRRHEGKRDTFRTHSQWEIKTTSDPSYGNGVIKRAGADGRGYARGRLR